MIDLVADWGKNRLDCLKCRLSILFMPSSRLQRLTEYRRHLYRTFITWKYANWGIVFLFGLAALMASIGQFEWAILFLVISGILAVGSSWRSKIVTRPKKIRNRHKLVPITSLRVLVISVLVVLYGVPIFYLAG